MRRAIILLATMVILGQRYCEAYEKTVQGQNKQTEENGEPKAEE